MKFRRMLLWTVAVLAVLSLVATLLIQSAWFKARLLTSITTLVQQEYGLQLTAGSFDYMLSGGIHVRASDVRLSSSDQAAPFLKLRTLSADAPYSILWSDTKRIRRVEISGPTLDLDHLPHFAGSPAGSTGPGLEIDQVVVKDGDVTALQKRFTGVSMEFGMMPDRIEIRHASGSYRAATIQDLQGFVSLNTPFIYSLTCRGSGDAALLADFVSGIPSLSGPLSTTGTVEGNKEGFQAKFSFHAPSLRVEGTGAFPLTGDLAYTSTLQDAPLSLNLSWEGLPMDALHRIVDGIPLMDASSSGTFHYAGGSEFWSSHSSLRSSLTETPGSLPVGGQIAADLEGGTITVHDSTLRSRSVAAKVAGRLYQERMQLQLSGRAGSVADLSALAPGLQRFPVAADFDGALTGPYAAGRIEGTLNAQARDGLLHLEGSYDLGSGQFRAAFQGNGSGATLQQFGGPDCAGTFHFDGNASGSTANPALEAKLSARDVSVGGVRIGEMDSSFNSDGQQLNIALRLPAYSGQFETGYAWKTGAFDVAGSLEKLNIDSVRAQLPEQLQALQGEISGSVKISGNAKHWKDAQGWFQFEDSQLAHSGFQFEIPAGSRLDLADRRISLDVNARSNDASIQLRGSVPLEPRGALRLRAVANADLRAVSHFVEGWDVSGRAEAAAEITGTYLHPSVKGTMDIHGAGATNPQKNVLLRDTDGRIGYTGDVLTAVLHGALNGAAMDASASISLLNQPGKIDVGIHSLDISPLAPESRVTGLFDVDAHAEGLGMDPAKWQGRAVIQGSDLTLEGNAVTLPEPVRIDLAGGTLTVQPFHIRAGEPLDLSAKGTLRLATRHVDAELTGNSDLSLLSIFVPELQGTGSLQLALHVTGPVTAPVFAGSVRTTGALLRVSGYPFVLENIQMDAPFDKDGITVKSFAARLGGGVVEGSGELPIREGKPGLLSFRATGRNVGLNYPEGLRSQVDADLQLTGSIENPLLSGSVLVLRSQYREDIDYRDRLVNTLLAQKKMLATASGATGRLRLDLAVKTQQSLRMHNNLAQLRAGGDLHISGTAAQPRISGLIQLREGGRILFEGNEYIVDHARLSFFDTRELNPVFDALLTTTILAEEQDGSRQEYRITITIKGPLDQLEIEPSSDSGLRKYEIYSLLLTGRIGEFGQTAADLFQRQLTAYLGGKLFFDFQNRIAGALGFSRFEIVPTNLILSEQDPEARVILGREVAPGLNVQYSALLSQHTADTWIVDYRLKNRFSLLFVEQEDGSYTGGLRHNLRFGGTRSDRTKRAAYRNLRIANLDVSVESSLGKEAILKALDLREGQAYDPWKLEDRADVLKQKLQQRGYLFPLVDITETIRAPEVDLQIHVVDNGLRDMEFAGMKISKQTLSKYEKWWREGLSESTVLLQITDDQLAELQHNGYHQARVNAARTESPDRISYEFHAEPGTHYQKVDISFAGNARYPSNQLLLDLSALYDSREEMISDALHRFYSLKDRIQALYVGQGYLDVQVDPGRVIYTRGDPTSVEREVHIQEGPSWRIARVEVSGGLVLPPQLQDQLKLHPGSLFDTNALSEDEITMTDFYHNLGYRNAQATADVQKESRGELVLRYQLVIGNLAHVAAVHITEGLRTKRSLIEKQVSLKPGDVLTPGSLMETQGNITALQLFRQVRVEPRETATPDLYDVEITIQENDPFSFTYGLRYDSEDDAEGEVQFQDGNLLGTGRNFLLYGRWSSLSTVYRLVFHSAPEAEREETLSLLPWRSLLSLSYQENDSPSFVSKLTSLDVQRRWELFGPVAFLGTLKFEQGRITSKFSSGGPIDFDLKQNVFRLIGVVLLDERNDPFDPRRGFFVSDEVEYAPGFLQSDLVFTKNYTQYFQYFSLGSIVSASAVRVGIAGDLVGSEHFFAGGSDTIRGFDLDEVGPHSPFTGVPLGGEAVLILNQEFRFPIYSWLGGVAFFDTGNVYPTLSDFSLSDLRNTAGFGLRLKSPYGILRFDLGFNLAPENDEPSYVLHIGLGQAW